MLGVTMPRRELVLACVALPSARDPRPLAGCPRATSRARGFVADRPRSSGCACFPGESLRFASSGAGLGELLRPAFEDRLHRS